MAKVMDRRIIQDFLEGGVDAVTSVPCKQLATLIQFYQIPLPMLISYRGEVGEPVACQVEMALHTKAILNQLHIPAYHFHTPADVDELPGILAHTQMCSKPVAILTDASFWRAVT